MTEDDLKSINDFDEYEQFIRNFILQNTVLWKLIYYPYSSPLSDEKAIDPEDPYTIFSRELGGDGKVVDSHGVVLFDDKDDTIQNSANVTILVYYESVPLGSSNLFDNNYIIFQIICKGESVRKLSNGKDRVEAIINLIDNEFDLSRFNDVGTVHRIGNKKVILNENNIGRVVTYKCRGLRSHILDNRNYLQRTYGVDSNEYL